MTPHAEARGLLWSAELVVLDFDGPLTRLFPGRTFLEVTDRAKHLLVQWGAAMDDDVARHTDHVQLLRSVHARDPAAAERLERWCTEQEVAAAAHARPVPAAAQVVSECRRRGIALAVVTNNAPEAVDAVLAHGGPALSELPVYGREPGRIDRLKPAPDMLLEAAARAGIEPPAGVMVGDTAGDVQAATRAGMRCIGLSEEPDRLTELLRAGALAVVHHLGNLLPAPE